MKTAEMKIEVSKGLFKKVSASELRLDDEFLKHQPKTKAERNFKNLVETAIKNGLKDFWRPVCDPSFDFDADSRISYVPGKKPAVSKSYNWWKENAKKYAPKRGSRIGTKTEYIAFLAVLIKELVATGWKVADAWYSVCNDSKELGHYWNSENAKHAFETTGSREICGWCDLANTYKVLADDKNADCFWIAGGDCYEKSCSCPLTECYNYCNCDAIHEDSCGWLVLDSCPDY